MGDIANRYVLKLLASAGRKFKSWCWNQSIRKAPGNSDKYALTAVTENPENPLFNKNICYLGSSVTFGACSGEVSFVEYIAKRNNTKYVKEAVSGTTLVDDASSSYVSRMKTISHNAHFDLFVVQLSTNDATQKKPLGTIATGTDFNVHTIIGAMEYIITYVQKNWECPIVFYTGSYYESEAYSAMVKALKELAGKYPIGVIDMYEDREFNDIPPEKYKLYMHDPIHPTKAGYLEWWVPKMEKELIRLV